MNKPLLTLIVPIYNVEKHLAECLNSVCVPTPFYKQIILINDGCTDGCGTIIDDFLRKFPGEVQVIMQKNAGLSAARNVGLAKAAGRFVVFVDSDDFINMNALIGAVEQAQNEKLQLLVTPYYQNRDNKAMAISHFLSSFTQSEGRWLFQSMLNQRCYTSAVWCYVWQQEFLEQHELLFTDGQLHEDLFFTFKALLLAERAGIGSSPFYFYRMQREGAITHGSLKLKNLTGMITALTLMDSFLQTYQHSLSLEVRSHLAAIAAEAVHKIALLPQTQRTVMHRSFIEQGGPIFIKRYGVQGKYKIARWIYGAMPQMYMRLYRLSVILKKKESKS